MRLVTLNLRHGGKRHMTAILERLLHHHADVLVLAEFRGNSAGEALCQGLAGGGLIHQAASLMQPANQSPRNGILIAARRAFQRAPSTLLRFDTARMLQVRFESFSLLGLHLPNVKAKIPHWQALLRLAQSNGKAPRIFAGDFNTGRIPLDGEGFRFTCAEDMERLEGKGWVDAWRSMHPEKREYTWFSHRGRGFRLDHAFLSPPLAPLLRGAAFDHSFRERGYSDHSALVVDVAMGPPGTPAIGPPEKQAL